MRVLQMRRIRLTFTGLVILAELLHLTWEATHGGVVSHHILNRADLPAISNWWGALLLPLLAWFLSGTSSAERLRSAAVTMNHCTGMSLLALGMMSMGSHCQLHLGKGGDDNDIALSGMFVAALLLPVYQWKRFSFVLGMTFTFGAVLPLIVNAVATYRLHFTFCVDFWSARSAGFQSHNFIPQRAQMVWLQAENHEIWIALTISSDALRSLEETHESNYLYQLWFTGCASTQRDRKTNAQGE
jgi:hypothetical protein